MKTVIVTLPERCRLVVYPDGTFTAERWDGAQWVLADDTGGGRGGIPEGQIQAALCTAVGVVRQAARSVGVVA